MIPGADQDATIIKAQMRGNSPRALVAIEPSLDAAPPPSAQHWRDSTVARWKHVFDVPDVTFTAATQMSSTRCRGRASRPHVQRSLASRDRLSGSSESLTPPCS